MLSRKLLFCMITILFWFSIYAYVPHITNYAKEMGATYQMIGIIAGSYGLSQTILRIPLGIASDRIQKKKIFIILGSLVTTISALIVYFFPNPYTLLLARSLAGIAASTWVNFTVMFASYFDSSQTTKAVGIINSVNKAGQFIAMLAGGFVALYFGIVYIFILSTIIGIITFILSFFIVEDIDPMDKEPLKLSDLSIIINNKELIYVSCLGALSQLITYGTTFAFTPLVAASLGANNLQLGYLSVFFILPQILFATLAGTIFLKYLGEKNTLLIGFALNASLSFVIPFVTNLYVLYGVQIANGIGCSITFPLLTALAIKKVNYSLRNSAMGFYQAIYGVGMIIGPILIGTVSDHYGLISGFIITGVIGVIAIITILIYDANKEDIVANY